ncbi:MAG: hypothetical protein ACI86H_001534 [bacterium]
MKIILDINMSNTILAKLPYKAKKWAAKAIAGVITADGKVTSEELEMLKETIDFLDSTDDVSHIIGVVKSLGKPDLGIFETDRKTASKILLSVAVVVISDNHIAPEEVEFFSYVGRCLGFEDEFSQKVIQWGKDFLELELRRKGLSQEAQERLPVYKKQ